MRLPAITILRVNLPSYLSCYSTFTPSSRSPLIFSVCIMIYIFSPNTPANKLSSTVITYCKQFSVRNIPKPRLIKYYYYFGLHYTPVFVRVNDVSCFFLNFRAQSSLSPKHGAWCLGIPRPPLLADPDFLCILCAL